MTSSFLLHEECLQYYSISTSTTTIMFSHVLIATSLVSLLCIDELYVFLNNHLPSSLLILKIRDLVSCRIYVGTLQKAVSLKRSSDIFDNWDIAK